MTVITTVHSYPRPAPINDPVALVDPDKWDVFKNEHAVAYVKQRDDHYLLHWIESTEPGHGSACLAAINEWADEMGYDGRLICTAELVAFYAPWGWVRTGIYGEDMIEMRRASRERE